jgi:uncharacterized LabA/DUF88 family protein
MPKVAIFIDGSNLYHGAKRAGVRIDPEKLATKLLDGRELWRTYFYAAPVPQKMNPEVHESQARFLSFLDTVDYFEVKLGRLEPRPGGRWEEKGVDTRLATDMVYFAAKNLYEVGILVTGDGDLAYSAQAVKDLGKHVENAYFKEGRSKQLVKVADRFVELTPKLLKGCTRKLKDADDTPVVIAAPTDGDSAS